MSSETTESSGKRWPIRIVVKGDDVGRRLDRFIKTRWPKLPIGIVFKLLRKRRITIEGRRSEANVRLTEGQFVEIREDLDGYTVAEGKQARRAERVREGGHFRKQFRLLHEDEAIVVLDKPGGIVVHPAPHHHRGDTLLDLLAAHLPDAFEDGSPYRPAFAHRLDRGTSGVIVAAKTREAAQALELAFRNHLVKKSYLTIVTGVVRTGGGRIDYPIRHERLPSGITRFVAVKANDEKKRLSGKMQAALTRFNVKERLPGATLVEVETETGRTHQIRAHFAAIGHPLAGDGDHGRPVTNKRLRERAGIEQLLLHAWRIELPHPSTGEQVSFEAPLPSRLTRARDRLRSEKKRGEERKTATPTDDGPRHPLAHKRHLGTPPDDS